MYKALGTFGVGLVLWMAKPTLEMPKAIQVGHKFNISLVTIGLYFKDIGSVIG
jgi:hypothetical protein